MQIIAEVGLAHDGSLNLAHAYVDAIADSGADCVKFQCHLPEESSPHERWRSEWSKYHETRADYWARTAFTRRQWVRLAGHAKERGLQFGVSVFCPQAVELMTGLVDFWKVPSGMVGHGPLLEAIAAQDQTTYLSNGLDLAYAWWEVLPNAMRMECVSAYPTPLDRAVKLPHGHATLFQAISDHSGTIWPALFAATWAQAAEVHVIFDRTMGGPDASSSITFPELKQLCTGVRAYEIMGTKAPEPNRNAQVYEPSIVNGAWMKTSGTIGESPATWWAAR